MRLGLAAALAAAAAGAAAPALRLPCCVPHRVASPIDCFDDFNIIGQFEVSVYRIDFPTSLVQSSSARHTALLGNTWDESGWSRADGTPLSAAASDAVAPAAADAVDERISVQVERMEGAIRVLQRQAEVVSKRLDHLDERVEYVLVCKLLLILGIKNNAVVVDEVPDRHGPLRPLQETRD